MGFIWERYHPKNTAKERMELTLFMKIAGTYGKSDYEIKTEDEIELSKTLAEKGLINTINYSATITPLGISLSNHLLNCYLKRRH